MTHEKCAGLQQVTFVICLPGAARIESNDAANLMKAQHGVGFSLPLCDSQVNTLRTGSTGDRSYVLCTSASRKTIGVEVTKWVKHDQVTDGKGRDLLETSYLKIIGSENEPRPDRIGRGRFGRQIDAVKQEDASDLRTQLFELLAVENAMPEPSPKGRQAPPVAVPYWNTPQGAPVRDFAVFPTLKSTSLTYGYSHVKDSSASRQRALGGFELRGGAYTSESMVKAAIDRIW